MAGSSRRRLKTVIAGAAVLALATLVAVRAIDLRDQRAQLLAAGDRRAMSLAVVFAGYLTQTFAAFDASLRQLALQSDRVGGAEGSDADWAPLLAAARTALPGVGSISVLDSVGIVRHSTQPLIIGQSRSANYIFRRLAVDTADEIVADPPFRALTGEQAYLIPLGRRIAAPRARFGGIVVATFLPAQLRDIFRSADVGALGMVSVFHRDGYIVLREPSRENPIGEDANRLPIFKAARRTDTNSVFRGRASETGPMLRTTYRPLRDRGLVVAVSLAEDELLHEWRRNAAVAAFVGVLLAIGLAAMLRLIFREMDLRVSAEEAFARSQRLESLGRLTGGIAHDFNNLLSVILGNVSLLRDAQASETPNAADVAASTAQIERAATRGSALVRQLLAFARRRPLQARTVDVAAIVRDAKPMLDRILGEDVSLETRLPPANQLLATVDPAGVESALLNLCINARDAMPNGGTITVELSRAASLPGEERERASDAGHYIALSVRDTGTGIPAKHLPHLFEPFFTTKDVGRGTGLGLATVYGFVKQSGGDVRVASELDRGTVVTLYLPEARDAETPTGAPSVAEPRHGSGEVILVVEDEADLLHLASHFLTELGYRVLQARTGGEALEVANREHCIDLLLTDIVMPGGMNGVELATALRKRRPDLAVLYVSGYSDDADLAEHTGARIIAKPYDREALGAAVGRVFRERVVAMH